MTLAPSIKESAHAIAVLGAPTVISLGLVWWLTQSVDRRMEEIYVALQNHEQNRAIDMLHEHAYLYAICLNTASGDTERARCVVAAQDDRMSPRLLK